MESWLSTWLDQEMSKADMMHLCAWGGYGGFREEWQVGIDVIGKIPLEQDLPKDSPVWLHPIWVSLAATIPWHQSPASLHQELSMKFPGFQHQTETAGACNFLELSSSLFSAHPTLSPLGRTLGLWSYRWWGRRTCFNPMVTTKQLCRLQMSCSLF